MCVRSPGLTVTPVGSRTIVDDSNLSFEVNKIDDMVGPVESVVYTWAANEVAEGGRCFKPAIPYSLQASGHLSVLSR